MSIFEKSCRMFCLLALIVVAGCGSDSTRPASPGIEPEVVNSTDTFQFQVSAVDNYSGVVHYSWTNTGTMANVDQSCAVEPGQAIVTLLDGEGNEVYSQDLAVDGSYTTIEGVAGDWDVQVRFTDTVGTLNFRLEKATP